eukprot:gene17351-20701_t
MLRREKSQQDVGSSIIERLDLAYRDITEINPKIIERFGATVKELDLTSNHLENNQIQNLIIFIDRIVDAMPNLRTLSMLKNEACPNFFNGHSLREYKDYRLYVLSRIKSLSTLDSTPITADEISESAKTYGNMAHVTVLPAQPLTKGTEEQEEDPKKKRLMAEAQKIEDKKKKKEDRVVRREKRRIRAEEKAAKMLEKEKEEIKKEKEQLKKEDEFTDSEEEEEDDEEEDTKRKKKSSKKEKSTKLPIFTSQQAPMAIIPPSPSRSVVDSYDADDEAGTLPTKLTLQQQYYQNDSDDSDDQDDDSEDDYYEASHFPVVAPKHKK